ETETQRQTRCHLLLAMIAREASLSPWEQGLDEETKNKIYQTRSPLLVAEMLRAGEAYNHQIAVSSPEMKKFVAAVFFDANMCSGRERFQMAQEHDG
ncbi:unnamed protein product, partial [Amoebophrya sp. A25]